MKLSKAALLLTLSIASCSAFAAPADDLGACLGKNTTPQEHKDLARWVFIAMSAHPELKDVSKVTPKIHDAADKRMAGLVTRLLTQTCAAETRAAGGNADAMRAAFEVLGRVAMQTLMSNPGVSASTQSFSRYLDPKKFEGLMDAQ